jgi:hypothetical protein
MSSSCVKEERVLLLLAFEDVIVYDDVVRVVFLDSLYCSHPPLCGFCISMILWLHCHVHLLLLTPYQY